MMSSGGSPCVWRRYESFRAIPGQYVIVSGGRVPVFSVLLSGSSPSITCVIEYASCAGVLL